MLSQSFPNIFFFKIILRVVIFVVVYTGGWTGVNALPTKKVKNTKKNKKLANGNSPYRKHNQ